MNRLIGIRGVDRAIRKLRKLGETVPSKALVRAQNKTARTVRAVMGRLSSKEGGLKVGDAKRQISIIRATKSKPRAVIVARGAANSLRKFFARQIRKGVSHKAYGRRQVARGAFMALPGKNSKGTQSNIPQVFIRQTEARTPIRKLWGPSIARILGDDAALAAIRRSIRETFPKRLRQEINFITSQLKG